MTGTFGIRWTFACAAIVLFAALTALPAHARKNVVTTIAQIGQPLAEITAGKADIVTLMGNGVDPHLYRLTRSDVAKINRADIVFYNGLHLEAQMVDMLARFAGRKPVVGIADTLRLRNLLPGDGKTHDPHVWMDPTLWAQALRAAVDTLMRHDPENAATYRTNAAAYFEKLRALDDRARSAIATIPAESRALVSAHDAFGYFGRAYAIGVLAIQGISTDSEAGLRKIEMLVDTLVERRISAVFIETTVSTRNVRALVEGAAARGHIVRIGGSLYSDAMGATGGYTGTYLGMFDHNVTTIVRALGGKVPAVGQLAQGAD
jgi:manganese/zinc/iron transport system substrate-binding protein